MCTIPIGTDLFRCRKINQGKEILDGGIDASFSKDGLFHIRGYDEANSKEAPHSKANAARINYEGIPYLYLAEDPYTACAEIKPDNHSFVSIAKFRIKKEATVLDLRVDSNNKLPIPFDKFEESNLLSICALIKEVDHFFATPDIGGTVYPLTQLIADHIRKAGFDGIRFRSAVSGGNNITLFNCHRSRVGFVDSKIIYADMPKYCIVNLEKGSLLEPPVNTEWAPNSLSSRRKELMRDIMIAKKNSNTQA